MQINSGAIERWFTTRAVFINTYMFTIIIRREPTDEAKLSVAAMEAIYGVLLDPNGQVTIPTPTINTFDALPGIETSPRDG